jgi:hypothetical protein
VKIFPIGDVVAASNQGTMNGVSYSLFEPNLSCKSTPIHTILQTKFQDQTMLSRKRASPYLQISYNYGDIFTREFRQIERFNMDVDESLTSFHVVAWDKGLTPSNVASVGTKWVFTVDDTYFYSATAGFRANRALVWNGLGYKDGSITGVTLNATFSTDVFTNNFGALSLSDAANSMVYPLYEVYMAANAIQNFRAGEYWNEDITTNEPGGYMYNGNIAFISRFKI